MLRLFVTDDWMLVATIGTVLIVLVVVSSMAAAMKRLRHETWHLMQLWSYVGIALALITPVRALLEDPELEDPELEGAEVTVLAGFSSLERAVLMDEVGCIGADRGFVVHTSTGPHASVQHWCGTSSPQTSCCVGHRSGLNGSDALSWRPVPSGATCLEQFTW